MLGSNPGSNQNAFSWVPAEPLSPVVSAVSPEPAGFAHNPDSHTDSLSRAGATGRARPASRGRNRILGISG